MATKVYFKNVATLAELEKEFKKLVVALHPDKNGNTEESNKVFAEMKNEYESKKAAFSGGGSDVSKTTHDFEHYTTTFNGKVYDYSESTRESVKDSAKEISVDYRLYLRSLDGTISNLKALYGSADYDVKHNIDFLAKVSNISATDFFDASFIKSCYLKHSFDLVGGGKLDNVLCEKRTFTEKTDLAKLAASCEKYGFPVVLDTFVEKAQTERAKDKTYYYMPVLNFSVSNVIKHLLDNTYKIKLAAFNRAKSAAKKKAANKSRKDKQKAKKAA